MNGPERIAAAFESSRAEGRAALMPFMTAGFPDPATSVEIARAYVDSGADLIELGIPFSDPLADGPVIHDAATRALAAGTGLAEVFEICRAVADRVPVVFMAYANTVLGSGGPAAFAERAVRAGAAGVILPDLPPGEDDATREILAKAGLAVIPLVAPTTVGERRSEICAGADGFIYVVAEVGTTGERDRVPDHLRDLVEDVKSRSEVPVAVGFGISTPENAATVGRISDGVIIGSKLVRLAGEGASGDAPDRVRGFLAEVASALRQSAGPVG